ncbi:MAG TPA: hypothetical protein EYH06_03970 [Chromatiales bacterium]|nr:hypothetical protein [Thiotrichales bacterium]HIP67730.1 hypothetical protein [Chromatiales bacterium]
MRKTLSKIHGYLVSQADDALKDIKDAGKAMFLAGLLKSIFDFTFIAVYVTFAGVVFWLVLIVLMGRRSKSNE